jgi:hypothetical protein
METAYIRFDAPQNATKINSENVLKRSIKGLVKKILERVMPLANPGLEDEINNVKYWLIEFDRIHGMPQREIGLDSQGVVIVKMPYDENYGYWTDNNLILDDFKRLFDASEISKESC